MKKSTISILTITMGISFVCLLAMQVFYIREIHTMHKQQFDESVNRALQEVALQLEADEQAQYTVGDREFEKRTITPDTIKENPDSPAITHASPDQFFTRISNSRITTSNTATTKNQLNILPLEDRINFALLDQTLKAELSQNGIEAIYHYQVLNGNSDVVYQCSDFDPKAKKSTHSPHNSSKTTQYNKWGNSQYTSQI